MFDIGGLFGGKGDFLGSGHGFGDFAGPLSGLAGGLFGNSGAPYQAAQDQYQKYYGQAQQAQQPFMQAGANAIPNFQNYLQQFQNPQAFMQNAFQQYQTSPYAMQQLHSGINAANNAASANGLLGSSNLAAANSQFAQNTIGQDQNQYLQNLLGIGDRYGQGQQTLLQGGQQSANALTNLLAQLGGNMGEASAYQAKGQGDDFMNTIGSAVKLAGLFA